MPPGYRTITADLYRFRGKSSHQRSAFSAFASLLGPRCAKANTRLGVSRPIDQRLIAVCPRFFRIPADSRDLNYNKYFVEGETKVSALEDYTSTGDDIDRQLAQISQSGQVDDELSKLKAELGQGDAPKEIAGSDDAAKTS